MDEMNKIAIVSPQRDKNGKIIGIRGRFMEEDAPNKYMPLTYQGYFMAHSLKNNLYGLYENYDVIKKKQTVFIYESEKSVLLMDSYFGKENNNSVATCGNKISKEQIELLRELGVHEVILCYDKDYRTYEEMLVLETTFINKYGGIESEMVYNYQDNKTKNSEYGSKISQSHKGKTPWNKGRKMTSAEIEVNSKSHIGIRRSKESIEKQKDTIKSNPNFGNRGKHLSEEVKAKISKANSGRVPYNKGIKNKTHKHDLIVPQLRNEYTLLKSYTEVHKLHPELSYDTIWSLIKYGDTNKHFKKCND